MNVRQLVQANGGVKLNCSTLNVPFSHSNEGLFFVDATIIELQKEVTKLLSSADELELMRNCKDEYEKANKENGR